MKYRKIKNFQLFVYLCIIIFRKMIQKFSITPDYIRFRRWSRNRYAAFYSLGRCVNIGTLSKSVIEASLRKQGLFSLYYTNREYSTFLIGSEVDLEESDIGSWEKEYLLILLENISAKRDNCVKFNLNLIIKSGTDMIISIPDFYL